MEVATDTPTYFLRDPLDDISDGEDAFGFGGGLDQDDGPTFRRQRQDGDHSGRLKRARHGTQAEGSNADLDGSGNSVDAGRADSSVREVTITQPAPRRRITGKRTANDARLNPPPTQGNASGTEGTQADDGMVTAAERRRLAWERIAEVRRRQREEVASLRAAWGSAGTAISADAYVAMAPSDTPPPFHRRRRPRSRRLRRIYGCVRCAAVVGWHGHHRLMAECRGGCPAGSRGPIKRLSRGLLPHRQQEFYGRDWPNGETSPFPFRLRFNQSRP